MLLINDPHFTIALFESSDVSKMIKEVNMMLSFKHPNVMTLKGVCVDQERPLIIMPFMSNGSVLEYVRNKKEDLLLTNEAKPIQVLILIINLMTIFSCKILLCIDYLCSKINTWDLLSDIKGNGILGRGKICPSRPGSQKLHVRELS